MTAPHNILALQHSLHMEWLDGSIPLDTLLTEPRSAFCDATCHTSIRGRYTYMLQLHPCRLYRTAFIAVYQGWAHRAQRRGTLTELQTWLRKAAQQHGTLVEQPAKQEG